MHKGTIENKNPSFQSLHYHELKFRGHKKGRDFLISLVRNSYPFTGKDLSNCPIIFIILHIARFKLLVFLKVDSISSSSFPFFY
jgi:hypothetical protein